MRVGEGASLTLGAGADSFCSFDVGRNAFVDVTGGLDVAASILGRMRIGNGSIVRPAAGTPAPSFDIGGTRVDIGSNADVTGYLHAPAARVMMGRNAVLHGGLLALSLTTDHSCRFGCARMVASGG